MSYSRVNDPMEDNQESKSESAECPKHSLVLAVMEAVKRTCIKDKIKVTGNFVVQPEDSPALPVMMCAKEDGRFLCWFVDGENVHLTAIVNENTREILSLPISKMQEFQDEVTRLGRELGEVDPDLSGK